jgi:hypothetical protein
MDFANPRSPTAEDQQELEKMSTSSSAETTESIDSEEVIEKK